MTTFGPITPFVKAAVLVLACSLWSSICSAQLHLGPATDEDTILVEKEASREISYQQLLQSVAKKLFQMNMDALLSGGKNQQSTVVRNFSDYADRMHYRLKVDSDSVQVKFSLSF